MTSDNKGEVVIYQDQEGKTVLDVRLEQETAWLNQAQMVELFKKNKRTISEHIRNIFNEEELNENSVVRNFRTTASDGKIYDVQHYNLDVIISIGYRVRSVRGTQFRIWANSILKEHLIKGYTLNSRRLRQLHANMENLDQAIQLLQQATTNEGLRLNEAKGLVGIISHYTRSFVLLNRFDRQELELEPFNSSVTYVMTDKDAQHAIARLKKELIARQEATDLFGQPKDNSFQGILGSIVQTFDGDYLYPTIEEQAAHLLYFIIKNHPFTDGNKRIGAFLFIWFLEQNKHRFKQNGELKINDNALVALALLIAQSDPGQKNLMIKLIIALIG